ncbi:hypothetical protein [Rhizobium sp. YTU87027]|uniref:hypothetical protein n=1 Tax=Rhizobium sp. YTU87027 TaxID=3417741 RepID=UPI003D68B598
MIEEKIPYELAGRFAVRDRLSRPYNDQDAALEALDEGAISAALFDINPGFGACFVIVEALMTRDIPFAFVTDNDVIPGEYDSVPGLQKSSVSRSWCRWQSLRRAKNSRPTDVWTGTASLLVGKRRVSKATRPSHEATQFVRILAPGEAESDQAMRDRQAFAIIIRRALEPIRFSIVRRAWM